MNKETKITKENFEHPKHIQKIIDDKINHVEEFRIMLKEFEENMRKRDEELISKLRDLLF